MTPSREHDEAVGAEPDAAAEIAQLRAELNAPSEREVKAQRLRELEARAAAKREATGKAKAMERQKGIRRAHGALVDQLEQDERRFIAGIHKVNELQHTFNTRYTDAIAAIEREDAALAHRFGLAPSDLAPVEAPARREAVIQATAQLYALALVERSSVPPAAEADENGLRQRRTYTEIAGTEGYRIIMEAGLAASAARAQSQSDLLTSEAARTVPAIAGHPARPFRPS